MNLDDVQARVLPTVVSLSSSFLNMLMCQKEFHPGAKVTAVEDRPFL
jgi:hypothetical protein